MPIRTKFILLIASVLMVVGLAMGLVINWQNSNKLAEHTNKDIKSTIDYSDQLVNFYLDRAQSNLTSLANDPVVVNALITKDSVLFGQVSQKMTIVNDAVDTVENISLLEVDGSSCVVRAANQSASAVVGRDFSDRDYCKGVLKTKEIYLSSAYISTVSKNPVLGLVVPVKNSKGVMLGFVYGSINLVELRGYLWDLQEDSKIELLDRYGVMFLNTEEKIVTLNNLSSTEEKEINKIKQEIANNKFEGVFQDVDNFVGYKSYGVLTIIFEKSATNLLALSKSLGIIVLVSVVVAIILTMLIVFIFIGSGTRKIIHLSKIALEISAGKFESVVNEKDFKGKDEISILAKSFNEMSVKLASVYKNLEEKVKERTKEVENQNIKLNEALDRTERANKLMVGRELEMIKLKKEIVELKKKSIL